MKRFSRVCQRLESVPFHRSKAGILAAYLSEASASDVSWALYLLLGGQLPRVISPEILREWVLAESGLPSWLVDECREQAGDFSETAALLGELSCRPITELNEAELGLTEWIEGRVLPLAQTSVSESKAIVQQWWHGHSIDVSWAALALAGGRFPVHVPRRVAEEAVREAFGEEAVAGLDARVQAASDKAGRTGSKPNVSQLDLFAPRP